MPLAPAKLETILVVDDNPLVLGVVIKTLETENFHVLSAISGDQRRSLLIQCHHSGLRKGDGPSTSTTAERQRSRGRRRSIAPGARVGRPGYT
jgi:CheY-like chemotaxis protein